MIGNSSGIMIIIIFCCWAICGFVWADACDDGMGAVLSQVVDGERRILGVWSKAFNDAQRRYHVREKEFLAVVGALRHFHHLVFPRRLHVVTDHKANVNAINVHRRVNVQKLLGWLEEVQAYDLDWRHVKGVNNALADFLSRFGGETPSTDELRNLLGETDAQE